METITEYTLHRNRLRLQEGKMDGGCYIPNNPAHYGLPDSGPGPGPGPGSGIYNTQYWPADDMGSFSLSPLDLDQFFPFSPSSTYKSEFPMIKERGPNGGDMADVLLSLKHPIVHPGQLSPSGFTCNGSPQYQGTSASLSYTVHPQMLSMSPGGGCGTQYCSGSVDQNNMFNGISGNSSSQHNVFPSMSVNVSMNMTMHGYPGPMNTDNIHAQMSCPQVQRGSNTPNTSPVYYQTQNILSPQSYNNGTSATYSFTADFRPQPVQSTIMQQEQPVQPTTPFKPITKPRRNGNGNGNFSANITASASASACFHPNNNHLKLSPTSDEDSFHTNLCRICGKTYARPSTLKTHLRTHSGEKPYRCDECNKSFSQAANLTAHVRTHSGEKPFRCPICGRRFSQSSSVTTHMRTHSGERPYRCRLCKKAFSDSSTLTKHLRIHSGEKPYQCKLCLLRFSQSGNLNRHMRVHGGSLSA